MAATYIAPTLIKRARAPRSRGAKWSARELADLIRRLMRENVKNGTGHFADVPGYDVGGKTGTANKLLSKGSYAENQRVASFVVYISV